MSNDTGLLLTFYGDDFTGSTDALESMSRAGARTVLFIEPPGPAQLARYPGLQALGVAGMTRSMAPDAMEAVLRPALSALRELGAPHVHYKVCSTFDSSLAIGSIGRVIDVAARIFETRFIPLLVGAPALGRYCVFGNLFARLGPDGEAFRLDRHPSMSKHPITPADESDLRLHLAKQTAKSIGLFDVLSLGLPEPQRQAALADLLRNGAEVVLFDALEADQLEVIASLIDARGTAASPLFTVGSSAVEMAFGARWIAEGRLRPRQQWPDPGRSEPLLVASGSCSPVTGRQIEWAVAHGFAEVALETAALAAGEDAADAKQRATADTIQHLKAGRSVIVHTSMGNADPRLAATAAVFAKRGLDAQATRMLSGQLFGGVLGRVIGQAVSRAAVHRLVLAGGDASSYAARSLGLEALEMLAPISPGAPLCRAYAPGTPADGLEINFKGGQVGRPDYFASVAAGKADS